MARLTFLEAVNNVRIGVLIRIGALLGIEALIDKNTLKGGHLFERGTYWEEGAKSNHYGTLILTPILYIPSLNDVFCR